MYSVNLVLELSLSFTKIGLADQFLEITLPCWKSSLRGRSRRFEKESPRSISWRKKGCCAIGRGGVKVVSAIGRGRVKGVSASELLPCRCLIKMPSPQHSRHHTRSGEPATKWVDNSPSLLLPILGNNKVSGQLEIFFRWNPSGTFRNIPWYH